MDPANNKNAKILHLPNEKQDEEKQFELLQQEVQRLTIAYDVDRRELIFWNGMPTDDFRLVPSFSQIILTRRGTMRVRRAAI